MWFFMAAIKVALVQEPLETIYQLDSYSWIERHAVTKLTPAGQLAMPNQSMAPQLLAILSSKVGNDISIGIGEGVLGRLKCIPLATISEGMNYTVRVI